MSTPSSSSHSPRRGSGKRTGAVVTILIVVAAIAAYSMRGYMKPPEATTEYYTVARGPLSVSITEGGALRATKEAIIRSEFAGTPQIIYIVPEGTYVTNGQRLVEFNAQDLKDTVVQQEISYQNALFSFVQATNNLILQRSQLEQTITNAEIQLEFAQTALEKYIDGDGPQARRSAEMNLYLKQEDLQRVKDDFEYTTKLRDLGYLPKTQWETANLSLKRTLLDIETSSNSFRLMTNYDQPRQIRQLQLTLQNQAAGLVRTKAQAVATLAQAESSLRTQQRNLELIQTQLEEKRPQLQRATIVAPQAGLVVYATTGPGGGGGGQTFTSLIEEGATVRQNQNIIKLPDVSEMLVDVMVHESHVLQVHPGQPAFVTVDSIPDRQFKAIVDKVAVLPNSQASTFNPNLKVYLTQVKITEPLPDLKPGVSARAEIIITNLASVLQVPIQAVSTIKGKQVVFVDKGTLSPVAVPVTVGYFNERFIEIRNGLAEGDRVLLSPPIGAEEAESAESTTTRMAPPASGGAVAASTPAAVGGTQR